MPEMSVVLSDKAPKFLCHLSLRASRPPAGRRGSVWRFSSLRRCFLMSTDSNWHLKKNKHYVKKKERKKKTGAIKTQLQKKNQKQIHIFLFQNTSTHLIQILSITFKKHTTASQHEDCDISCLFYEKNFDRKSTEMVHILFVRVWPVARHRRDCSFFMGRLQDKRKHNRRTQEH